MSVSFSASRTRHDEERHYVHKKLGFLKLALELGLDVVPMVGFGENQLFTTHQVGAGFRKWLLRTTGMGMPFVTGRWGCTLLPHASEVVHVYGKALKVGRPCKEPTEAMVEDLFKRYKQEVCISAVLFASKFVDPRLLSHQLVLTSRKLLPCQIARLYEANAKRLLPAAVAAKGITVVRLGVDEDDRS